MISEYEIPGLEKEINPGSPVEFVAGCEFDDLSQEESFLSPAAGLESVDRSGYQSNVTDSVPPGTSDMFSCLYAAELLTVKQEYHLFRKMNYLRYLAEQIRKNPPGKESNNDFRIGQPREQGNPGQQFQANLCVALSIRNYIVTANLRLVISIAKKLVDANNSLEDLFAQGNVPLIRAVEIFDFERGIRFSTYATWAVRNHLYRITKKSRKHHQSFVTGDTGYFEGCRDRRATKADSEATQLNVFRMLESVIHKLSDRDQIIVSERFGLFDAGSSPRTFREIGVSLGISTERVRQLLHRSLERLQGYLDEHDLELRL
ncbi:MAG: sigma-70 family RNA polymerase sigma factor [Planctomycetaceae bacterium]|nr:sigma-70 family RNA polymerase sigma factor [Planctomycetaceae bacterium]